ncbi:MAG: HNH endonuclease [Acetobacter sp.]|nr:HNH endonuclease [Bacteroides sp.]MCM1341195.1 HNH endonuclease [Acetobacter sp.]MCM1433838.1 HNH endonuclease [Clostridiales bacterium]
MESKYLKSLSKDEYWELTKNLHNIQNCKCYICRKEIDFDLHSTNIDHIIPLKNKGKDSPENFALTHESCNKSKQDADLTVARSLSILNEIKEKTAAAGLEKNKSETASLKHVLEYLGGSKYELRYKIDKNTFSYTLSEMGDETIYTAPIFTDNISGEQTVFIELPIEYIYHDELINPRGINSSIRLLVKEFYQKNPQLHLSLARINNGKIEIFDGQHKAVAQLLLCQRNLLIRLFINPDIDRLITTNTNAGSKLRQIAFDKSIMRQLHDTLYAERIKKYQQDHNLDENDYSFSEQQLVDYFKGESNIKKYINDSAKNQITHSPDNKLRTYIDFEGRAKKLPISYNAFEKTFLTSFLDSKKVLSTPINFKIDEGSNPREIEQKQIIHLMNIIAEEIYIGKFNAEVGIDRLEQKIIENRDSEITDDHLAAFRISKEEIMSVWIMWLKKVIENYFSNTGKMYDQGSEFQKTFDEQLWINITNFIRNLIRLPLWKNRDMASTIFSGKNNKLYWKIVFETGKNPEGVQVLSAPLNFIEMIKAE